MRNRFTKKPPSVMPGLTAVVGSGELISRLFRDSTGNYTFDLRRADTRIEPELVFHPEDLRSFVKLAQVLAFAIADDGWLPPESSRSFLQIFNDLDEITQRWDAA